MWLSVDRGAYLLTIVVSTWSELRIDFLARITSSRLATVRSVQFDGQTD